jgi:predicted TIM-barrel fold metal-dependent hydrolase
MSHMSCIDVHLHLDEQRYKDPLSAAKALSLELEASNIELGLLLNLFQNTWSRQAYANAVTTFKNLKYFINVHPFENNNTSVFDGFFEDKNCVGLKLHPRLDGYPVDSTHTINLVRHVGKRGGLVLVDAFADGLGIMNGFDPVAYGRLAQACPDTKIIFAHMGGHRVIAKRFPNFYLDVSYSLLYFRGSSVTTDIVYAIKSMKAKKILYGSDYPDRDIATSLNESLQVFREGGLSEQYIQQILYSNSVELLGTLRC